MKFNRSELLNMAENSYVPVCVEFDLHKDDEIPEMIFHWGIDNHQDLVDDTMKEISNEDTCARYFCPGYKRYAKYFAKGFFDENNGVCLRIKLKYREPTRKFFIFWGRVTEPQHLYKPEIRDLSRCDGKDIGIFKDYDEQIGPHDGDTIVYHLHSVPSKMKCASKR